MAKINVAEFRAVYCSGAFIPSQTAVTALSLLFEKVHLPNNVEIVKDFATRFKFTSWSSPFEIDGIQISAEDGEDPFSDLSPAQRDTALKYISESMRFAYRNEALFGEVFESEFFSDNKIMEVELVKEGGPGELNTYNVKLANSGVLRGGDENYFSSLIDKGYVPVIGRYHPETSVTGKAADVTAKQLATLLAMKSIEMMLPQVRAVRPEEILEAREKLREQLPPFWSAMFKTSVELKKIISNAKDHYEVEKEAVDLVDRTIRPAVIDLVTKLEKERKDWFYKILAPVRSGLRLLVGNPLLTQQQLLTNALVLTSDACVSIAENLRSIDSLKREAGLSYLLDLSDIVRK